MKAIDVLLWVLCTWIGYNTAELLLELPL